MMTLIENDTGGDRFQKINFHQEKKIHERGAIVGKKNGKIVRNTIG